MLRALSICLPLGFLLGGAACGYTLTSPDHGGLGRVVVHAPENPGPHQGLDRVVADALRREVLKRPGSVLVEDSASADWVLRGRVLPLQSSPASLSPVVLTLEVSITVALELRGTTRDGREVVGDPRSTRETERYLTSADPEAQRKNRDEALRRAARLVAARFLDQLAEAGRAAPAPESGEGPA